MDDDFDVIDTGKHLGKESDPDAGPFHFSGSSHRLSAKCSSDHDLKGIRMQHAVNIKK